MTIRYNYKAHLVVKKTKRTGVELELLTELRIIVKIIIISENGRHNEHAAASILMS